MFSDYRKFDNEHLTLDDEGLEFLVMLIRYKFGDSFYKKGGFNYDISSYGLKHIFEKYMPEGYISNMDFKEAMKREGIPCSEKRDPQNVNYPIKKSVVNRLKYDSERYYQYFRRHLRYEGTKSRKIRKT